MKRITIFFVMLMLIYATTAEALVYRAFTSLTGEVVGSVDNVDCTDIGDGSEDAAGIAHLLTGEIYFYYFDDNATDATSSPDYIRCKNYVDGGVWIKLDLPDDDIDSEHYTDGSIDEAHLNIANSPTDEYALTYESDTSNLQWTAIPGGGDITTVGGCTTGDCTDDFIDGSDVGDDVIDSEHYAATSVDREHLAADIVDGTKVDDDVVDSEHYVAGSIDEEHLNISNPPTDEYFLTYEADTSNLQWTVAPGGGDIETVGTCTTGACTDDFIDGTDIADEAVDSEHYTDGSIDPEHLNIANAETDEYVLTYEADTSNLQWVEKASGDITTVGDCTTGDCTDDFIDDTDIADDSIKEEHLDAANSPTDEYVLTYEADTSNLQWVSLAGGGDITTVGTCTSGDCTDDFIDGSDIGDDVIESEHYAATSIDKEHLAADVIDETKMEDDSVDSEHYNDASIDPAHLNIQSAETNLYLLSYASGTSNFDWIEATAYGHSILALADEAALQALITSPWAVADGGTGVGTLTDGGVLLGSGTGAVTPMAVLADGEMIVGDGTTDPVAESGATLRTSIGVGTGDTPQFTGIELGHASDNTLTASSGTLSIEGSALLETTGTGASLTAVDAITGDSATAFFDAGTIEHERGGLEADVSAYEGIPAITGGATYELNSAAELESAANLGAYASDILGAGSQAALQTVAGLDSDDSVTHGSVTSNIYHSCVTSEPTDYVFGQIICTDGASWNPTSQSWTGFQDAEKKHWISKVEPAAADCVDANDPHACCSGSGTGETCVETWKIHRDILGNQYFSGFRMPTTTDADGYAIPAEDAYRHTFYATGAGTWTLPAVADGMNLRLESHTTGTATWAATGDDIIRRQGVAMDLGDVLDNNDLVGVEECTYYGADTWSCWGDFIDGGGGGSTCALGTLDVQSGDVEEFENAADEFCDNTNWSIGTDTNSKVDTYSTTAGILIDTQSLEIDDDDTVGGNATSYVMLDTGATDNNFSIKFKYKANTSGGNIAFAIMGNSAINPQTSKCLEIRADSPTTDGFYANASDDSANVRSGYSTGTTICIELEINPYTGGGDTSTITTYDSDCSTSSDAETFEINNTTCRYLYFGGVSSDTDDHHFGIDDVEFTAADGGF